ncbi:type I methionyl aminopeptidase [bacterium F11]|nr:type I methionyl aminopeptidase [bacterium F11]
MEQVSSSRSGVELKNRAEIASMRKAGQLAGLTLDELGRHLEAGIPTKELDQIANKFVKERGGVPTFVGYRGYPATICVSINEQVVHGIPSSRKIVDGDIVSIDFATTVDGFVGDTARTWAVGNVSDEAKKLIDVTQQSLAVGIDAMKPGSRLGDVGAQIQKHVEKNGFGVVRDFVGHGIGRQMHEEPAIPNYGRPNTGIRIEPGLVIAIEPMVTMKDWQVRVLEDGWTVVTKDGSLAAHFEHTVAMTEDGPIILTQVE